MEKTILFKKNVARMLNYMLDTHISIYTIKNKPQAVREA